MGPKAVVNWNTFEQLCQEVEKFPAIRTASNHKKKTNVLLKRRSR